MMKYIRFKARGFVLFNGETSHADIAASLDDEALSAGLVVWVNRGPACCGKSMTLGMKAEKQDTARLRATFEV